VAIGIVGQPLEPAQDRLGIGAIVSGHHPNRPGEARIASRSGVQAPKHGSDRIDAFLARDHRD
jgi:hypothetical protein